jgi:hypothetical protein
MPLLGSSGSHSADQHRSQGGGPCNSPANHTVQTRALHAHLRWRNANARHRDVLAAERKERARIRREKGIRWGGYPLKTTA